MEKQFEVFPDLEGQNQQWPGGRGGLGMCRG